MGAEITWLRGFLHCSSPSVQHRYQNQLIQYYTIIILHSNYCHRKVIIVNNYYNTDTNHEQPRTFQNDLCVCISLPFIHLFIPFMSLLGSRSFPNSSRNALWLGQKPKGRHVLLSNRDCSGCDRLGLFLEGQQDKRFRLTLSCTVPDTASGPRCGSQRTHNGT